MHGMHCLEWSPNGECVAKVSSDKLVLEKWKPRKVVKSRMYDDTISEVSWSEDSKYLAVGMFSSGTVRVICLDDLTWKCKVETGRSQSEDLGLICLSWAPASTQLLTTSSLYADITIWSISKGKTHHIDSVLPIRKNKSFHPNGQKLAVLRFIEEFKKVVSVYASQNWEWLYDFEIAATDPQEIYWSPDGKLIGVLESALFGGLHLYSLCGEPLKIINSENVGHRVLALDWGPSGQFLLTVNHRNVIRVLNCLSFGTLLEEKIEPNLVKYYPACDQFTEVAKKLSETCSMHSYEKSKNMIIPVTSSYSSDSDFRLLAKFSSDGRLLSIWSACYASTVWIWDIEKGCLTSVLVHLRPVTDFSWQPNMHRLGICTERKLLHFWTDSAGATVEKINTNEDFNATSMSWNPREASIGLVSLTKSDSHFLLLPLS